MPEKFENYIYLSQATQNECIDSSTIAGAPAPWSSIDYYGNQALQYGARHFNAPLNVSMEDEKDSIKMNGLHTNQSVRAESERFDFEIGTLAKYDRYKSA